jgi:squalene-hopene/tetraprenyl-beta-curcumene cyclase
MLRDTYINAREALVARRSADHWDGRLSTSALSTATAVVALSIADPDDSSHVRRGLEWLAAHQNADGGWGDTADSPSNISTTVLGWAACGTNRAASAIHDAERSAERWIARAVGSLEPPAIAAAVSARYGNDRTFSTPILLVCALCGRFGSEGWRLVPQLPFEIAACPREWFKWLRLPVVSYALPALIAIGLARHANRPSRNPLARLARDAAVRRTLDVLGQIQPAGGGFLEAVPLTAFVVMSLTAGGRENHPVVRRGVEFLRAAARGDGGWPIDTNLATWVTTLAVNALGSDIGAVLGPADRAAVRDWLLRQQHRVVHPYTGAEPGGWAWTDLPGGVPDADDTAGALLALRGLGPVDDEARRAATAGIEWLLKLQNRDGGIPTFCRGWTNLPFDRSGPDLTAHALRAWAAWRDLPGVAADVAAAARRAIRYLADTQRTDGAWVPLWFGNQQAALEENPTYGTSRVLVALHEAGGVAQDGDLRPLIEAGTSWLLRAQNADGGWGGATRTCSTMEETALAVSALAPARNDSRAAAASEQGLAWLTRATAGGCSFRASPIGLYFAKLWYSEELYPIVFTVAALRAAGHDVPRRER